MSIYAISYADEPVLCDREGRIESQLDPAMWQSYIYASRIFTPAPYTRSMRLTVRMPISRDHNAQINILELDERKDSVERMMREDILNYLEGLNGDIVENVMRIEMERLEESIHASFLDRVTGRKTWWDLWPEEVVNTRPG